MLNIPDQADGLAVNNTLNQLASPDAVLRNEQRNQQFQALKQAPQQAAMAKKAAMGKELDSFIAMSGGTPQALQAARQKAIMSGVFTPEEIKQSTAMYSQYATDAERVQHATASVADFDKWNKEQMDAKKPISVAAGGSLLSPTGQTLGSVPPKPEKNPDWQNPAYVNYENQKAKFAAGLKPESGGDGAHNFTPDAIDNAAARYNIDGTLPPMGMGKNGSLGRSAILNRAAELAKVDGISSNDQRINQIGNKANTAALSKIQQQQTMVGAFEKNFNRNADIALEYSAKVDRTGTPMINKWINAGKRAGMGDPDLAAYDAVIKSTSNEYAKIISGSMGNTASAEGEIKKVESLLNSAQTPEQVTAVINMMKRETANRMKGFDEEKASLRSTMSGKRQPQPASGQTIKYDANGNMVN